MKMITISVIYFIVVIVLAHFFTLPEYSWMQNTVSDLAAQGLKNQWIMQAGFIGFGLLLNLGFIQKFISAQKVSYPDLLIMLYGLAILLSGFFSTEPFIKGVSFSVQESNLHSSFATVAGISFSLGIFSGSNGICGFDKNEAKLAKTRPRESPKCLNDSVPKKRPSLQAQLSESPFR